MATYHSALHKELDIRGELDYYEANGSVVFRHDLTSEIPSLFHNADAIYSEPAWRDGYAKFIERANAETDSSYLGYLNYLSSIEKTINKLTIPAYILMGKHMLKYIHPDQVKPINLHGNAVLGVWGTDIPPKSNAHDDVLNFVANNYGCVLDFSCGYGNVAKAMTQRHKRFVCSDINPKCVYYVAKTFMGYNEKEAGL
jgi:SAM-dependent methyltransferase